jgi:hypothetical protein
MGAVNGWPLGRGGRRRAYLGALCEPAGGALARPEEGVDSPDRRPKSICRSRAGYRYSRAPDEDAEAEGAGHKHGTRAQTETDGRSPAPGAPPKMQWPPGRSSHSA